MGRRISSFKRKFRGVRRGFRRVRKAVRYAAMPFKATRHLGKAFFAALRAKRGPIV